MIDSIADGTMAIEGMDATTLKTYQAQIEATDMAMFLSKDGAVNVNVVYQAAPMKYDSNTIISAVYPAVLQQYQGVFSDYAPLADPQVEKVGDLEFVETAGTYTLGGMKFIMLQAYHGSDSALMPSPTPSTAA